MSDLVECECYHRTVCHYCGVKLDEDAGVDGNDEFVWADFVISKPNEPMTHILAHAWCTEGQANVEMA